MQFGLNKKKILYLVPLILLVGLGGVFFAYSKNRSQSYFNRPCPFCNEEIVSRQKFYEDDLVIALYTHKPVIESHFQIIPKRHVDHLEKLSQEEMARVYEIIGKVNRASSEVFGTEPYFIHQKNGQEAGQTVPHVHFHLIAKKKGDSSDLKFGYHLVANFLKPKVTRARMKEVTEKMTIAIQRVE